MEEVNTIGFFKSIWYGYNKICPLCKHKRWGFWKDKDCQKK